MIFVLCTVVYIDECVEVCVVMFYVPCTGVLVSAQIDMVCISVIIFIIVGIIKKSMKADQRVKVQYCQWKEMIDDRLAEEMWFDSNGNGECGKEVKERVQSGWTGWR